MPDAMTRLLANVGLSDLERRLRDEAIDETTFLELDDNDLKEIGIKIGPRRKLLTAIREAKDRRTTPGADWARSPPPPPPPPRRRRRSRLATEIVRTKTKVDPPLSLGSIVDSGYELRAREASGAADDEPEAAARTATPGAPVMECDLEEWC